MDFFETLNRWQDLKEKLAALSAEELKLRTALFAGCFPEPREGTNNLPMPTGYTLRARYPIYRTLDPAKLDELVRTKRLPLRAANAVKRTKVELAITGYRDLDPDTRKIVDEAITAKPGTPSLELVPPREDN